MNSNHNNELWRLHQIIVEFGVTKRTVYNWIKRGQFPKPCKKIGGTPYWDAAQIKDFVQIGEK